MSWNPCAPLIVGFVIGFIGSFKSTDLHRWINKDGIGYTQVHLTRYLIPGLVAAILVAILQATGTNKNGFYDKNYFINQTSR